MQSECRPDKFGQREEKDEVGNLKREGVAAVVRSAFTFQVSYFILFICQSSTRSVFQLMLFDFLRQQRRR